MVIQKACPICGRKGITDSFGFSGYWYCPSCITMWMKTFPKVAYRESYYKGKSTVAARLFSPIGGVLYRLRSLYLGLDKKKLWIDVGAGEGAYLETVNAARRIGVEVSASGRKMMKKRGLETMTEKEFLEGQGLKADVISFWHVLEHTEEPWKFIESARRNIVQGGKIVVGIPNINSFEFNIFEKDWFHFQPQFHLWHFSDKSIAKLIDSQGFKVEKIDYWSVEHHLTGVLQSFVNKSSGRQNVLHHLIRRGVGISTLSLKDVFWSVFWLTLGLPVVIGFWTLGSILGHSGTIVVIASPREAK